MRKRNSRVWSMVLAAGDGTRLAALTADTAGNPVPKQYCSLAGDASLLQDALSRGAQVAPHERVCTIVSAHHRPHWHPLASALPAGNVIVQPRNCGTANGVLLALLHLLDRDPLASIVFLPADHYVRDEMVLARGLRRMVSQLARRPDQLLLLGIAPDEPDPELGYIVPGAHVAQGLRTVSRFEEKPPAARARELLHAGALWNSFIFAAQGTTLLGLMRERMPEVVDAMETALARDAAHRGSGGLLELYARLPSIDFSRSVIQGAEERLCVVDAAPCGWTDLGTPRRVLETLRRPAAERNSWRRPVDLPAAVINLARQQAVLQMAG